ncbi:MAG TPA: alanine--tRNA ligase [Streptosporangiaceae bacterium]|jgi:alanyl-tRNA synthetase
MESAEIARRFLTYFEQRGHTVVPSAPLQSEDPTLLFVVAGMVPFLPYLLGQQTPPYKRAASKQKCLRTLDIERVGTNARSGTFFQMLGSWSFGDYFKKDAIPWAWDLLTKSERDGGFGFPEDRLWVTVYLDDDEAFGIWRNDVGLPEHRIQRMGKEENYWDMGVPGPCGPDSEIFYDRGPEYGRDGGPAVDDERFMEIWNLVFMQYSRGPGQGVDYEITGDLPAKNIDTGMGLERMAIILQGVDNLFEIDTTWKVLDRAAELTGQKYGSNQRSDVALRVVADHVDSAVMLVADGVLPSNEGAGYVLRRLLRRSVRNLRLLSGGHRGGADRFLHELTTTAVEAYGPQFPDLVRNAANIQTVIDAEEAAFSSTLRTGSTIFDMAVGEVKRRGGTELGGAEAFQLHDTYGFPIDLTLEMAAEQGLKVDEDGFRRLMTEQRQRARKDAVEKKTGNADVSVFAALLEKSGSVEFTGYDQIEGEATVIGLLRDGVPVPSAAAGTEVGVVLDRTPFYAEGGGQLADAGVIRVAGSSGADADALVEIFDVQSPLKGVVVHHGRVRSGEVATGSPAYAAIDTERRRAISRSHTATHLLHRAFRGALGESAAQAGSENSPGRLRFDFTAAGAVPASMLGEVEDEVNHVLTTDLDVRAFHTSIDDAREMGALALFGEKYPDEVRVVEVGDYSRELCGGTHVARSGQLGLIKVLGEASIGAGVRRVEALVGMDAFRYLAGESVLVSQLSEQLKTPREDLPERISGLVTRLRDAQRELEKLRSAQLLSSGPDLVRGAQDVGGVTLVAQQLPDGTTADGIRKLALDVRGRLNPEQPAVVVLAAVPDDRPVFVVAVNDTGRRAGLAAGRLAGVAAKAVGGGGGGKDDVAQGGGAPLSQVGPQAIAGAFEGVRTAVRDAAAAGGVP